MKLWRYVICTLLLQHSRPDDGGGALLDESRFCRGVCATYIKCKLSENWAEVVQSAGHRGEDHKVNTWAFGKPNAILVRQLPLLPLPF
jgi:hypothetical protein